MNEALNPQMLVLARESRALSQTELSHQTGIPQAALSRYEKGMSAVPGERLDTLAATLSYPVRFFFRSDQVYGYGSACFYHRKQQSLPVRKLKEIQALMNVRRIQIEPLLRDVHIDVDAHFDRMDIDEYKSPEEISKLVRRNWRLPYGPIQNLVHCIESAGGIVVQDDFRTRKLDAISQWLPGGRPLFFVNESAPGDRLRFTLAHEIGHIIMHTFHSDDQEREADRFAAELLMPEKEIKRDLSSLTFRKLGPLKGHWKVAMAALIRRAYDLKQISYRQYQRFFTELNKLGYRFNEPYPITQEESTVLRQVIDFQQSCHHYSVAELSYISTANLDEFRSIYLKTKDDRPSLRVVE